MTQVQEVPQSGRLSPAMQLRIHELMVKSRAAEERCIQMSKAGDGWFWIGAPGEEALGVPLGLQVKKGEGLDHDFLHLHYRSSPIAIAMGLEPIDIIRQMGAKATDPFSRGRNFVNHYAVRRWNIVPMAPTIETQFSIAVGTGIAQRRHGGTGITIVNGGDGGTHEGDFATCLLWSIRPGQELPILMITANNSFAISTPACTQHGVSIAQRVKGYGIPTLSIDGNDVHQSWKAIAEGMAYVREKRKPFFIEAKVSRLHGHSSSSGANRVNEEDPITRFEQSLIKGDVATRAELDIVWSRYREEMADAYEQVKREPYPDPSDVERYMYAEPKENYYNPKPRNGFAE
ncbi:MAG: thiamine pyrophosphate-dependent dehydrogenase E1 component subunit alpha [Planctomycetes bacterium]|nr:thiamine pyrophosphate-dependent dehydrogenase E1 component subunit alpha [Planctomycetota bacterium]